MSRQLPVPLRPARSEPAVERPEVIVLDRRDESSRSRAFGRLLLGLTPDLLRAVERSLNQREASRVPRPAAPQPGARAYRSAIQLSEVEYDLRAPFVRKVTVRKATAWSSDTPFVAPEPEAASRRGGRLRWAGLISLGGACALAALGVLANRAGSLPGIGSRRGY